MLDYLWSGWAALGSLLLIAALWQVGHDAYGTLVLPAPGDTLAELDRLFRQGRFAPAWLQTATNALTGFALAALIGAGLGVLAGLSPAARRLLEPVAVLLLGIPAIAWVVLAILWFGGSGRAASFTVIVTTAPITYSAAAQGVRTLDNGLRRMARAFQRHWGVLLFEVYLPHLLSYLLPALAVALALSWKLAVMAELLSGAGGIGDELATARVQIDTVRALAWIVGVVLIMLAIEYALLEPLRRHMRKWQQPT